MPICRVLIVDDQRDVRRVLRAALETLGQDIQITDVPSGEEAILVISRQPVEVMIADVRLPGISGLELIERARVRNPNLRLVLITGMVDEKVRRQVEMAQADAFFYKPIEIRDFLETMQMLLGLTPSGPVQTEALQPAPAASHSPERFLQTRIATLRREINAGMTALVDASGEYRAQDGRLPLLAGELTAALEAARRMAVSTGSPVKGATYLSDGAFEFFVAPVSEGLWLVTGAVHRTWYNASFGRLADALWTAVQDLRFPEMATERADYIKITGVDGAPPDSPRPNLDLGGNPQGSEKPVELEVFPDLDRLFEKIQNRSRDTAEADAFWNSAAEEYTDLGVRPNGLTFEEALQMGLAPDED